MTVFSALSLAGGLFLVALAVGVAMGSRLAPRALERRQRVAVESAGITVAQMLECIVALMPLGHRGRGPAPRRRLPQRAGPKSSAWCASGNSTTRPGRRRARPWATALTSNSTCCPDKRPVPGRSGLSVHGQARLLSEEDRRFAVVFVYDHSEYARMEATRRDFVANVSHELKTPVGAMAVLAEALLASADDPETVRRFGEKVLVEANRLGDMVSELIELSRLQGAERLPDMGAVDVDTVVSEAISRHKVPADNSDITVCTDEPSGLRMLGEQALLVTALANLVSNAIAYSPRGSLVSISRRRRGENVEISVTDRGIGIAHKDQERVFERFFRADKARSRATGGTGLGLAIVKHVAANHNGTIGLWSQLGTGSTFTLSIPAYDAEFEQTDKPPEREIRPKMPQREPQREEELRR